jgi:hypothetical protein
MSPWQRAQWAPLEMEEDMKSRFVVKASALTLAAFATTAFLEMASPLADTVKLGDQPTQNHRTNSAAFGALTNLPLQCSVSGSGDVAKNVYVLNQTGGTIPAGKSVSWTVKSENTGAKQNGSTVLKQNLGPQQKADVGDTLILSSYICTASVKL